MRRDLLWKRDPYDWVVFQVVVALEGFQVGMADHFPYPLLPLEVQTACCWGYLLGAQISKLGHLWVEEQIL